jgi:hypothetical protein
VRGGEGLGLNFDLVVIELEAIGDGESPLNFQFDAPRTTEVTSSGQSVLSEYVDGSDSSSPTAVQVAQLAAHKPVTQGTMALLLMGALLVIGVGRRWIGSFAVKNSRLMTPIGIMRLLLLRICSTCFGRLTVNRRSRFE